MMAVFGFACTYFHELDTHSYSFVDIDHIPGYNSHSNNSHCDFVDNDGLKTANLNNPIKKNKKKELSLVN